MNKMFKLGRLVNNIDELLAMNSEYELCTKTVVKDGEKQVIEYVNLPIAFDIETSSFYTDGTHCYSNDDILNKKHIIESKKTTPTEKQAAADFLCRVDKQAIMYIWQIAINGNCVIGRTWAEFDEAYKKIIAHFNLSADRKAICYVHNLGFEFEWIRKRFKWAYIFAREKGYPMTAETVDGLEFRCSYILSGLSLEKTLENLTKYKIQKKTGDLDYSLIRTPLTKLKKKELGYCINDVIGLNAYIQEQIELYKGIVNIPLTNTGRVRKKCREHILFSKKAYNYRRLMQSLTIDSIEEYQALNRAFAGGFVHASYGKAGTVFENVFSKDRCSAYPTEMVAEMYPMSKAEHFDTMTVAKMEELAQYKCIVFDVEFDGLYEAVNYEHYISLSKCTRTKSVRTDNGRVISAMGLKTTITNVDWQIIKKMYTWDDVKITNCYVYEMAYLPTPLIEVILELYYNKCILKDDVTKVAEYLNSKGMLNSCFGMAAMDILMALIKYDKNEWNSEDVGAAEQLERYNNDKMRFLFYAWTPFITAYARRSLFYAINELKDDYLYSDTDCTKYLNKDKHEEFFARYNAWIIERLTNACKHHKIDIDKINPVINGKSKPLGIWENDGEYTRFKALAAKRYLVEYLKTKDDDGNPLDSPILSLKVTIAGINKKLTSEWLESKHDEAFDLFDDDMLIPEDYTGRLICTHGTDAVGTVVDYLGQEYKYNEQTFIHMEAGSYHMSMTPILMVLVDGILMDGAAME